MRSILASLQWFQVARAAASAVKTTGKVDSTLHPVIHSVVRYSILVLVGVAALALLPPDPDGHDEDGDDGGQGPLGSGAHGAVKIGGDRMRCVRVAGRG